MSTEPAGRAAAASAAAYRESLTPPPLWWVAALAIAASSGVIALRFAGAGPAVALAVTAAALVALALVAASARVEVADGRLRAGQARIPVALTGRVAVLDAERMRALRGPQADARAYLCQRGWLATGVVVEITDPADPVPYWLISSRTPERLAAALQGARDEPVDGSGPVGSPGPSQTSG